MHPGRGPGLTSRRLGQRGGVEMVTVTEAQMPNHTHSLLAAVNPGDTSTPQNTALGTGIGDTVYGPANNLMSMADQALPNAGGSQPHNNLQPFLVMNFIIALVGTYPSRS